MYEEKNILITEDEISTKLKESLKDEINVDIAVAFWGEGNPLVDVIKSKNARIICNLETGGTNPKIIEYLLKYGNNLEIKQNSKLHAKVYLGDSYVIIGSSNFSTNGMVNEGSEIIGWHEANVYSSERHLIKQSAQWFNNLWNNHAETREITRADLRNAKIKWENKRKSRTILQEDNIFQNPELVKDKNIYIYNDQYDDCSRKALKAFNNIKEERHYSDNYGFFECNKHWKPKHGSIVLDFETINNKIKYRGCLEIENDKPIIPLSNNYNIVVYRILKKCPDLNKDHIKAIHQKMIELNKQDKSPLEINLYRFIKKYMHKSNKQ